MNKTYPKNFYQSVSKGDGEGKDSKTKANVKLFAFHANPKNSKNLTSKEKKVKYGIILTENEYFPQGEINDQDEDSIFFDKFFVYQDKKTF